MLGNYLPAVKTVVIRRSTEVDLVIPDSLESVLFRKLLADAQNYRLILITIGRRF